MVTWVGVERSYLSQGRLSFLGPGNEFDAGVVLIRPVGDRDEQVGEEYRGQNFQGHEISNCKYRPLAQIPKGEQR